MNKGELRLNPVQNQPTQNEEKQLCQSNAEENSLLCATQVICSTWTCATQANIQQTSRFVRTGLPTIVPETNQGTIDRHPPQSTAGAGVFQG